MNFEDWANQEMQSHGSNVSFKDWLSHEVKKHENATLKEWGRDEMKSHNKRYGAEGKKFSVYGGRGFQIVFENGYKISVMFGVGNYADHHRGEITMEQWNNPPLKWESRTAEVAVFKPNGDFVRIGANDDVAGWLSPSEVSRLIAATATGDETKIEKALYLDNKSAEGSNMAWNNGFGKSEKYLNAFDYLDDFPGMSYEMLSDFFDNVAKEKGYDSWTDIGESWVIGIGDLYDEGEMNAETFAVDVIPQFNEDGTIKNDEFMCGECKTVYDDSSDATICCKCPYCDEAIHEGECIKNAETFEARGNMNVPLQKRGDYHYNCPYCKEQLTIMGGNVAVCENGNKRCHGLEIPRQYLENFEEWNWYHNERKGMMAETFGARGKLNPGYTCGGCMKRIETGHNSWEDFHKDNSAKGSQCPGVVKLPRKPNRNPQYAPCLTVLCPSCEGSPCNAKKHYDKEPNVKNVEKWIRNAETFNAQMDGEKLMVGSRDFNDGSMMVGIGTEDIDSQDPDFMEMMIGEDGGIEYFTMPTGVNHYQRMYKPKPAHYGKMKTQNETNKSAGGDFIRIDGDGKNAETFESSRWVFPEIHNGTIREWWSGGSDWGDGYEEGYFINDKDGNTMEVKWYFDISQFYDNKVGSNPMWDGGLEYDFNFSPFKPNGYVYWTNYKTNEILAKAPFTHMEKQIFEKKDAEESDMGKTVGAIAVGGAIGMALFGLITGKNLFTKAKDSLKQSAEAKKDCHSCNTNGSVRKNHTQVLSSEYSVGQINPVEVEGQNDVHGAEGITNPRHAPNVQPDPHRSKSLRMW